MRCAAGRGFPNSFLILKTQGLPALHTMEMTAKRRDSGQGGGCFFMNHRIERAGASEKPERELQLLCQSQAMLRTLFFRHRPAIPFSGRPAPGAAASGGGSCRFPFRPRPPGTAERRFSHCPLRPVRISKAGGRAGKSGRPGRRLPRSLKRKAGSYLHSHRPDPPGKAESWFLPLFPSGVKFPGGGGRSRRPEFIGTAFTFRQLSGAGQHEQ